MELGKALKCFLFLLFLKFMLSFPTLVLNIEANELVKLSDGTLRPFNETRAIAQARAQLSSRARFVTHARFMESIHPGTKGSSNN